MKDGKFLTITEMAYQINRNPHTVMAWVRWTEGMNNKHPKLKLPEAVREAKNGGRAWKPKDIPVFKKFAELLSGECKGEMSVWNAQHQWGKRGKKILKKKGLDKKKCI